MVIVGLGFLLETGRVGWGSSLREGHSTTSHLAEWPQAQPASVLHPLPPASSPSRCLCDSWVQCWLTPSDLVSLMWLRMFALASCVWLARSGKYKLTLSLHIQVLSLFPCMCQMRWTHKFFPAPRIETKIYESPSITLTSRITYSPYPLFHDRIFLHKWHLLKSYIKRPNSKF